MQPKTSVNMPRRVGRASLAALALAAAAGAGTPTTEATATQAQQAQQTNGHGKASQGASQQGPKAPRGGGSLFDALMGGGGTMRLRRRRFPGLGWPVAVDRRMAKKRRNKARNKAQHRGKRA